MSQKKQKLKRKLLSNIPKLEPIMDEAWEQCFCSELAYHRWIADACAVLHRTPDYPIEQLTPNRMLANIFSEVVEQLTEHS